MVTNRQLFYENLAQTSAFPLALEIEKAEGIYLTDVMGKKYMDLISGIAVSNIGHNNPKVKKAITEQLDKYMHLMVYGEYIQSPQVKLAAKISELLPEDLSSVYFVNSGSEAIEGAIKLSKRYTKRTGIISFKNSYHGSSHGALSIMGNECYKRAFRPLLPDVKVLDFNIQEELDEITDKTACVIVEPFQAEAGIRIADSIFHELLRKKCNDTGTLLIFDEIQTAFGRTAKMFGFQHFNVMPDIITFAKGMGGGMPIGAFVSTKKIMQSLTHNPVLGHITTFGGHPVCCAAALANIEEIIENDLLKGIDNKEKLFRDNLKHPKIKDIRGVGLFLAIEFEDFEQNKAIIDKCIENGLIVDWFLFCDNSMRICPPLIINQEQILKACQIIIESINQVIS